MYFFEAEEREGIEKGRSLFLNCSVAMINWDIQSDQYQSLNELNDLSPDLSIS
tara:strand:+ start:3610 stop:3768 length:159 start_codon:yes stop_codon:yes gene_type:complete